MHYFALLPLLRLLLERLMQCVYTYSLYPYLLRTLTAAAADIHFGFGLCVYSLVLIDADRQREMSSATGRLLCCTGYIARERRWVFPTNKVPRTMMCVVSCIWSQSYASSC